jgi:hypothetical protein
VKKKCSATNQSGQPCRAWPRTGRDLCLFHDPGFAEQRRANAARGGRISRPPQPGPTNVCVALSDRTAVQATLDGLLRLQLFGKIPLKRSSHILRTLSLAVRNFDKPIYTGLQGYRQTHAGDDYWDRRNHLDHDLEHIAHALTVDHQNARAEAISDASAKVYEIGKVKQLFTSDPTA